MRENHMTLQDLITRLEAATGPDRELDADIHAAVFGGIPAHRAPKSWMRSYSPGFVFWDKEHGTSHERDCHAPAYTSSERVSARFVQELIKNNSLRSDHESR
jgi:hypothetical protein